MSELQAVTGGPASDRVRVRTDGPVARITLDCPGRLNALDIHGFRALEAAVRAASGDPGVRVILLGGVGRAFCTGADLAALDVENATEADFQATLDAVNSMVDAIVNAPIPVVAKVNGLVAGVGVSIAIAADLAYADPGAYLLLAFVNIGLMPDGGAAAMVAAAAGRAVANEMALLGERMTAEFALRAGIYAGVLAGDELDAKVEAVVARLAAGPRRALELTKQTLNAGTLSHLPGILAREKTGQVELLQSADFAEGRAAMLGKRPARFA